MSMLKNFLNKAKKTAENVANEIAAAQKPYTPKSPDKQQKREILPFDETFFTFQVVGGSNHSDPIQVLVKVREGNYLSICKSAGEKAGFPLPSRCKWFKSDASDAMVEMPWLVDSTYRPSIDDVGTR
jgi:hypothetical protein